MGENTPEHPDLECGQCASRFRIRPTKGRLPRGPVDCPACGAPVDIPQTPSAPPPPAAAVMRPRAKSMVDAPADSSDEARLLQVLSQLGPEAGTSGTLLGMPAVRGPITTRSLDESTATLDATREKFEESTATLTRPRRDTDEFPGDFGVVSHTPTKKVFALDEHSESEFNNRTKAPWESKSMKEAEVEAVKAAQGNVRKTKPSIALPSPERETAENPRANPAGKKTLPALSKVPPASGERPKLADLLKQVREKRGPVLTPPPTPRESKPRAPLSLDRLDELIESSANDLADAFEGPSSSEQIERIEMAEKTGTDPRTTPFGKARAETVVRALEAHGMAAEQTGSGFIRIPAAEILDVIGHGTFRLKVEGVVYEPIDEAGIRRLVVAGVLAGNESIAPRDGDWMPMRDHAFFQNAAPAAEPLTQELEEISDEDAMDSSGELFPTLGHLSPDQSADLHRAYVEDGQALLEDDEPRGPLTAELDIDDVEDMTPEPPETPAESAEVVMDARHEESPDPTPDNAFEEHEPSTPSKGMPKGLLFGAAVVLAGGIGLGVWLKQASVAPDPTLSQTNQSNTTTNTTAQTSQTNAAAANTDTATNNVAETNNAGSTVASATAEQTNNVADPVPAEPTEVPQNGVLTLAASQVQEASTELVRTTPTIRFRYLGASALFLADNGAPHRGDRATLATQAFCENVGCGVAFPTTREAFLPTSVADELQLDLKGARVSEKDGVKGYHGVIRWVVDDIAQLPLNDLMPVWRRWMRASDEDLYKAVSESEQEIAAAIGAERAAAIIAQTNGTQLRSLVRQISNVLVLDYLTNNFERFDSATDRNAWNLGIKDGKVYSLDDTDAFQARASTRIKGRFSWAERFDQAFFDAAQNVDREALQLKMFPDATAAERVTLRVFWRQYDAYLERIRKETTRANGNVFF